jgi:hypothetical protein
MTETELSAGQMYLSALLRIGELKRENERLKDKVAELERRLSVNASEATAVSALEVLK